MLSKASKEETDMPPSGRSFKYIVFPYNDPKWNLPAKGEFGDVNILSALSLNPSTVTAIGKNMIFVQSAFKPVEQSEAKQANAFLKKLIFEKYKQVIAGHCFIFGVNSKGEKRSLTDSERREIISQYWRALPTEAKQVNDKDKEKKKKPTAPRTFLAFFSREFVAKYNGENPSNHIRVKNASSTPSFQTELESLTPETVARLKRLESDDLERFNKEMDAYLLAHPPKQVKPKSRRDIKYFFTTDFVKRYNLANPDNKTNNLKCVKLPCFSSEFELLTALDLERYQTMVDADLIRFNNEMNEYLKTHISFIPKMEKEDPATIYKQMVPSKNEEGVARPAYSTLTDDQKSVFVKRGEEIKKSNLENMTKFRQECSEKGLNSELILAEKSVKKGKGKDKVSHKVSKEESENKVVTNSNAVAVAEPVAVANAVANAVAEPNKPRPPSKKDEKEENEEDDDDGESVGSDSDSDTESDNGEDQDRYESDFVVDEDEDEEENIPLIKNRSKNKKRNRDDSETETDEEVAPKKRKLIKKV
jgi:hypothetical protein